jgi:lipoprotein-releasing system permease protein
LAPDASLGNSSGRPGPFNAWERSVAYRYLLTKRAHGGVALISLISFTAIALSVAALIITMSIMNGFRSELTAKILGFNPHVYVTPGPGVDIAAATARLRAVRGVTEAMPVVESEVLAQGPNGASGAIVRGVTAADLEATRLIAHNLKAGSLASFGQGGVEAGQVVLGQKLAESLGADVGDEISLISPTGSTTVFGAAPAQKAFQTAATFSVGMSEYDQTFLYMPLDQAQAFLGRGPTADYIAVRLDDPDQAGAMRPQIAAAAGPGAAISDWTEKNRAYFGALKVERNVMRLIFLFIVALAAMNIISGLVMLVKNKGRDIAILRTIGAPRSAILRIFFMAGAAIGVTGALAGLTFGLLFCFNIEAIQAFVEWVTGVQVFNADIYFLAHVPAKVDWGEVALVLVWTLGAAFIFSLLPAARAARLDPVEALRFE